MFHDLDLIWSLPWWSYRLVSLGSHKRAGNRVNDDAEKIERLAQPNWWRLRLIDTPADSNHSLILPQLQWLRSCNIVSWDQLIIRSSRNSIEFHQPFGYFAGVWHSSLAEEASVSDKKRQRGKARIYSHEVTDPRCEAHVRVFIFHQNCIKTVKQKMTNLTECHMIHIIYRRVHRNG